MVASRLAQCGALIIDSDLIAREVLVPGTAGLRAVVDEFGESVLAADGTLDRSVLAAGVFDNPAALARLNAIVHPLVAARSAELVADAPADAVVVQDVPLLVEVGMAATFALVMVVHADAGVRLRRLVEQRGVAESDAAARIAAQATDEQRHAVADVWLDNNGSRNHTFAAVDQLWTQRLVPFEANLRHRRPATRAATPVVVAPEGSWLQQARRVIARVAAVAGSRAHRIDHIGSTAVPALDAKDVLDVQVVVDDLARAEHLADDLVGAGLIRRDGRWWDDARDGTVWDKAMATNADPTRAVDCHLRPAGSPTWRETVLLRDWLRAHPTAVREYATAQTPFVCSALDRAEQWARRTGWRVA